MKEISFLPRYESYIFIEYTPDYCHFLRHVCRPIGRIKRLESRNVKLIHRNGRKQTFTILGQTVLRGKAGPINHFTIPSIGVFLGPATPTALRRSFSASFPRTQVYENKLALFCPHRLLIYIRAALSDHLLDTPG